MDSRKVPGMETMAVIRPQKRPRAAGISLIREAARASDMPELVNRPVKIPAANTRMTTCRASPALSEMRAFCSLMDL